jgi:hypothetical protein
MEQPKRAMPKGNIKEQHKKNNTKNQCEKKTSFL